MRKMKSRLGQCKLRLCPSGILLLVVINCGGRGNRGGRLLDFRMGEIPIRSDFGSGMRI
jgi:hypothetical protein